MERTSLLGIASIAVGLLGYALYYNGILRGTKKPHAFSWLIWSVLTGITFAAQLTGNAGAGAWVSGVTTVMCFGIFALSLSKGERSFPPTDWMTLCGAGAAILLWVATDNPAWAVILVVIIDAVAFIPSVRKGWHKPHDDGIEAFAFSALKYGISLFALASVSLTTALYPVYAVIMNGGFALFLVLRRRAKRCPS